MGWWGVLVNNRWLENINGNLLRKIAIRVRIFWDEIPEGTYYYWKEDKIEINYYVREKR